MAKFTNITPGAKGLRDEAGNLHMVEAGQSIDIKPGKGELDTGWFREGDADSADQQPAGLPEGVTIDQVREQVEQMRQAFEAQMTAANDRADAAEAQVERLTAQIAAFDQNGDGAPGGSEPANPPALSDKTKAELLDIAKAEDVAADDSMTKAEITAAIETKRAA